MNQKAKKRLFFLVFLLTVVGALTVFHHTLICSGMKLLLNSRLPKGESLFVDYEKGGWEEGGFALHHVNLSRRAAKDTAGFDVHIEEMRLHFSLQFFPFEFHTELILESPEIALFGVHRGEKPEKGLYHFCKKFLFKKEIAIHEGKLTIDQNDQAEAYFSLHTGQGQTKAGWFALAPSLEKLKRSPFYANFSMQGADVHFDLQFDKLELPWMTSLATGFSNPFEEIHLMEGTLQGKMALGLDPSSQVSKVEYDLKLDRLAFSHPRYGTTFHAHQIHWKEHFTSSEEMNGMGDHPFFEKIWPYFIGDGEFLGVRIGFEDPKTAEEQGMLELRGKLSFSPRNEPLIDFYGLYKKEKREYPLRFLGEAAIEEGQEWKLAWDLSLHEEGGEKMSVYASLSSKGDKHYLFDCDFKNLALDPLELIQNLAHRAYVYPAPLHIQKGSVTGSLGGLIHEGHVERVDVKAFEIEECSLFDEKRGLCLTAEKIEGSGEFDFSTDDFFDGTFWQLMIQDGSLLSQGEMQMSELSGTVSMHDQYVKPSSITAALKHSPLKVAVEGLYTHLKLKLEVGLTSQDLFYFLGKEDLEKKSEKPLSLFANVHLKTEEKELEAEGMLAINKEKGGRDVVTFLSTFDREEFFKEGVKKSLKRFHFEGEDLSSETFNLPLDFFETSYNIKGKAAVEGEYTPNAFTVSIDPSHLEYHSPYIVILAGEQKENSLPLQFCYAFDKNLWTGTIPLKDVVLKEQSFGLVFDHFNSDVALIGDLFEFNNVTATSDGVFFEGKGTLDYQYGEYGEFAISTEKVFGSTQAVQSFLRHFAPFANLNSPVEGTISSNKGGMALKAYVGEKEEMLSWEVSMQLKEGMIPITPTCSFEGLTTRFEWSWEDQVLRLIESDGNLRLGDAFSEKLYHLNIPVAEADFIHGQGNYDLRLETPTHDICRLYGEATFLDDSGEIKLSIDEELTRFFGTRVHFGSFSFNLDGSLRKIDAEAQISSRDLYHHLDFLVHAGLIPFKASLLEEMQSPRLEGETYLKFAFDETADHFMVKAHSDHFAFGTLDLETLDIHAEKRGNQFIIDRFQAGSLGLHSQMTKEKDVWNIESYNVRWKNCQMEGEKGVYHPKNETLSLPLERFALDLLEVLHMTPQLSPSDIAYLKGRVISTGTLDLFFPKGWKNLELCASLQMKGDAFSKGNLSFESEEPLECHFSLQEGLTISKIQFNFFHPRSHELWAKCHLESLKCHLPSKSMKAVGCHVVLPPEMLHHLGATHALPDFRAEEECLVFMDQPFNWDNQMELSFDFELGKKTELKGKLKEGYYWIQDKAWYLSDFRYHLNDGDLHLMMSTLFDNHPLDMQAKINLLPHLKTAITLSEKTTGKKEEIHSLTILTDWNDNEEFFIQSIEGTVAGLTCSFHHNPKTSFRDQMVLTGQLKINMPSLAPYLPDSLQSSIQEFEIGNGYELSGDCVVSKEALSDSHFTGYLKGKKFQLMGSEMETLMSEISIHTDQIELSDFSLSDASGLFAIDHMRFAKNGEEEWNVSLPKLTVQDFRPSLLKKIGKYRGKIKPLTVREMHFDNIRGTLGNTSSFRGKGTLHFTNTFKSDYNLLDIPFEILGRLGLDMGLLVPVRGHLNFVMQEGKVYLTELSDSYSEGKRSKFYLSPVQHSFIDFNGNVNINIKMKQYVLLKVTEPFTLSIGGTFENLRYSLK